MIPTNQLPYVSELRLKFDTVQRLDKARMQSMELPKELEAESRLGLFVNRVLGHVHSELKLLTRVIAIETERTKILAAYSKSRSEISRCEEEFQVLVKMIIHGVINSSSYVYRTRENKNRDLEDALISDQSLKFQLASSILNSKTLGLSENKLSKICQKQIEEESKRFAQSILERFIYMHESKLIGEIKWLENNCAVFSYISQRQEASTSDATYAEIKTLLQSRRDASSAKEFGNMDTSKSNWRTTRTYRIHTTFEHYLVDAFSTTLALRNTELHPTAQSILDAFPPWLKEELRVVHGTLVTQRSIEQEIEISTITEEIPIPKKSEDSRISRDPALTFGPFVLFGWLEAQQLDSGAVMAQDSNKKLVSEQILWLVILGIAFLLVGAACVYFAYPGLAIPPILIGLSILGFLGVLECFPTGKDP